ncbi:MAG: hypothetical protein ABWZ25_15440 [Chitinophagaceae bacterium]
MTTNMSYEKQLEYLQSKLKVSREYILETCGISRVSLEKIIDYLENNKNEFARFYLRV